MTDLVIIPLGALGTLELPREIYQQYLRTASEPSASSVVPEKWLNSRELAELTGLSDWTLEQMALRAEIPSIKAGKSVRFKLSEVEAALRSRPRDCASVKRAQQIDSTGRNQGNNRNAAVPKSRSAKRGDASSESRHGR